MTEKNNNNLLPLSSIDVRVLASLIEKQYTTPNQYPLTLNSLQLACNQKSSRNPVMSLETGEVGQSLNQLIEKELVYRNPFSSRAEKFEQRMDRVLGLSEPRLAILCVLMLRGDQTISEIKTNSQRIYAFESVVEVKTHLEAMMLDEQNAFVTDLPKKPGTKEIRFTHLLAGEIDMDEYLSSAPSTLKTERESEITALHARIDELELRLDSLEKSLSQSD